jgi:flagellar basal-body rod modification protein FlgD
MSSISSVLATQGTQTQSDKDRDTFVGTRDDFLTILLAQLKHQDPLEPMKGTEFIDSITRLSAVEQTINQNTHLENIERLLGGGGSAQMGSPVSYLDRNVEFTTDKIAVQQGVGNFAYNLTTIPDNLFIEIKDSSGKSVFTSLAGKDAKNSAGNLKIGKNTVSWDGTDNSGNKLDDGVYSVSVAYKQKGSEVAVNVPVTTTGVVNGANFQGGNVSLNVGDLETTLDKIVSIKSTGQVASQN